MEEFRRLKREAYGTSIGSAAMSGLTPAGAFHSLFVGIY
jgi:hypothetical protein